MNFVKDKDSVIGDRRDMVLKRQKEIRENGSDERRKTKARCAERSVEIDKLEDIFQKYLKEKTALKKKITKKEIKQLKNNSCFTVLECLSNSSCSWVKYGKFANKKEMVALAKEKKLKRITGYLSDLKEMGFVNQKGKKFYSLSSKGRKFVEYVKNAHIS